MRINISHWITGLLVLFVLGGVPVQARISDFVVYAENEFLILWVNPANAEFIVQDKRTDTLWYSNPPERATEEKIARGAALQQVGSQFSLSYYTPGDNLRYLNNRADSVAYEQFEIFPIEQGVRIEFTLGKQWDDQSYLPVMISKERFESLILAKLGNQDKKLFEGNYELVKLEIPEQGYERQEIYRLDKVALFGEYTFENPNKKLNTTERKNVIELVADQIVANRSDLADRRGLIADDFSQFKDAETYVLKNKVRTWDLEDMIEILKDIDYTPYQTAEDHRANHLDEPVENYRTFHVAIEYTLDGDQLVVCLPLDDVMYPENVFDETNTKVTLPLYSINLLEYFGAGSSTEQGYMLVPDASGALIHFNNGKLSSPVYMQQVYGIDAALNPRKERTVFQGQTYLPVFGLKHEGKALFAMIDAGEPYVRIKADIAGRTSSYNVAYPEIVVLPVAKTQLQGSVDVVVEGQVFRNDINVYQKRKNSGDVVVRYAFLYDEQANYVGMAQAYQNRLVEQYGLERLQSGQDLPLFLEFVGAVHAKEPALGIPRTVIKPLTSFEQAQEIVAEVLSNDINNLKVRYSGWLEGGLQHRYPNKVRFEDNVGNQAEFAQFNRFLQSKDIDLFLDVNFININKHGLFDGFIPILGASRYLSRQVARIFEYDLATYKLDPKRLSYVLSPRYLDDLMSGFMKGFANLDVAGISLRGFGTQLNSDFRENTEKLVDRKQSLATLKGNMDLLIEQNFKILVEGANAYTLPFVDSVVNVPLESSKFNLADESVPFLPIVLHGFVNFAGQPINLAQDYRATLLRTIEAGASPYYLWSYVDPFILKDSNFTYLYSTNYRYWFAEAIDFYQRANSVLRSVQGNLIVDHEKLAPDLYGTWYENGDFIVVNYRPEAIWVNSTLVPALDFAVIERGKRGER